MGFAEKKPIQHYKDFVFYALNKVKAALLNDTLTPKNFFNRVYLQVSNKLYNEKLFRFLLPASRH